MRMYGDYVIFQTVQQLFEYIEVFGRGDRTHQVKIHNLSHSSLSDVLYSE